MNEVNALLAEDAFLIEELSRKYAPLQILVEAGISRVWRWIKGGTPYGMLSAEKHDLSARENRSRTGKLGVELAKRRLGGILIRGYYKEEGDPEPVAETAYFVPLSAGMSEPKFRDFLVGLAARLRQETILYSPGSGQPAMLMTVPDGKAAMTFNRLSFNPTTDALQYAWSEVRRHKFVFLECAIGARTNLGRWAEQSRGLLGGVYLKDLRALGLKHPELLD